MEEDPGVEEHARSKKWFAKKKKEKRRKRICRCNACSDRVIKCARTLDARRARETSRDARGSIKNAVITFRQRLWNLWSWSSLFLPFESRPSRFVSVLYRPIGRRDPWIGFIGSSSRSESNLLER